MRKLRSYVLPFAIVMGLLFHRHFVYLSEVTPYLIFTILLLNNVAVDMKKLRVTMLDVWIMLFQAVVSLGSYFIAKGLGAGELVAQGILGGVLCPVAASSVVIATILGANRETVTTYTIVGNLMVAVVAPVYFSFIGTLQELPLFQSMWLIFRRTYDSPPLLRGAFPAAFCTEGQCFPVQVQGLFLLSVGRRPYGHAGTDHRLHVPERP